MTHIEFPNGNSMQLPRRFISQTIRWSAKLREGLKKVSCQIGLIKRFELKHGQKYHRISSMKQIKISHTKTSLTLQAHQESKVQASNSQVSKTLILDLVKERKLHRFLQTLKSNSNFLLFAFENWLFARTGVSKTWSQIHQCSSFKRLLTNTEDFLYLWRRRINVERLLIFSINLEPHLC